MAKVAIDGVIWLTRPRRETPLGLARNGVLLRTLGLTGLVAGLGLSLGTFAPPSRSAIAAATPVLAAPIPLPKDLARLPIVPPGAAAPGFAAGHSLFHPVAAAPAEARFAPAAPVTEGPATLVPPEPGWREGRFEQAAAADGRTLAAGTLRIRLDGIVLPAADEVCRTLDGRLESCRERAATQLELITRGRPVECRYRAAGFSDEAEGQCRIGASDLGERLIRTGYVKRAPARSAKM